MSNTPNSLPYRPAPQWPATLLRLGALCTLGALCALTACETEAQRITHHDDALVRDGFQKKPADTPERQAMLSRLPVNHFVRLADGDTALYVYSDPTVCTCIYVGNQRAYDDYKADRQSTVIVPYDDANWNWHAW